MKNPKLVRVTTIPISLKTLLKGQFNFMASRNFKIRLVSSPGEELRYFEEVENQQTCEILMPRSISLIQDFVALIKFFKYCVQELPQIVHSHTPKAGIVGMMGAWLARVPIRVHTVAGLPLMEATGFKRKLLLFVEKLTYRFATMVYPNSKGLYEFILENKLTKKEKLKIIANGSSNGIDTVHFAIDQVSDDAKSALKNKLNLKDSDFIYVFVGRLVGDKGINELIAAFEDIAKQVPHAKLLLVGPPEPDLDPLKEETIKRIANNSAIISVGFQNDVRPYFAIADALVFPSYREGFPNVVMQAGAMELPSIVTNINGCNEIIEDGKNGIIIPPKDVQALKNAMLRLMEDKELYSVLKSNARPMITSRYEQKVVWEALLAEYDRLLAQKGLSREVN